MRTAVVGVPTVLDVVSNDSDPDNEEVHLLGVVRDPVGATVPVEGDTIRFTGSQPGDVTFRYTIQDPIGSTDEAEVTVHVLAAPADPVAVDDHTEPLSPGTKSTFRVLSNDLPSSGVTVEFDQPEVTTSADGVASFTVPSTTTVYTYRTRDAGGRPSRPATLTVHVVANRPPERIDGPPIQVDVNQSVTIDLTQYVTDPEGVTLTFSGMAADALGQSTITGGARRDSPRAQWPGNGTFRFSVTDGTNPAIELQLSVLVRGLVNQPPKPGSPVAAGGGGRAARRRTVRLGGRSGEGDDVHIPGDRPRRPLGHGHVERPP